MLALILFCVSVSVVSFAQGEPEKGVAVQAITFFAVVSDNGKAPRIIDSKQCPDQFLDRGMAGVVTTKCLDRMMERSPKDENGEEIPSGSRQLFLITTNEAEAKQFRLIDKPNIIPASKPLRAPRARK